MRTFTLYLATAPDGRGYIGCTSQPVALRWRQHATAARMWFNRSAGSVGEAIERYGAEPFTVTELACARDEIDARVLETALIAQHGTMAPGGLNKRAASGFCAYRAVPQRRDFIRIQRPRKTDPVWPLSEAA